MLSLRDPVTLERIAGGHVRVGLRLFVVDSGRSGPRGDAAAGALALRRARGHAGIATTSTLTFPSARLSLTHAGGMAVAVAVVGPGGASGDVVGIGVDFEPHSRQVDRRAARLYLSDDEAAVGPDGWLRLWTVKEAAYKATPDNRAFTVAGYRTDGGRPIGTVCGPGGVALRYASLCVREGWLSVAVMRATEQEGRGRVAV